MTTISAQDFQLADRIQSGLEKCVGKSKAANSKFMIRKLKDEGFKVNGSKIRELIHYLRTVRKIFICGDTNGYYVPSSFEEEELQIKSLTSRIREITEARDALLNIRKSKIKQEEMFV